ncbi:GNAT family N-acetyltransferase [Solibacillus isronensis]|uniref:GNAT family N-acetyltransferase n=1 Tax=Solibacillus isronensis TaxID=412383 RepID=UPI002040DA7F|nr:GNAT family N-acetyltransferase [Solibacillus isronensis]MCM3721412.1 GNAT family N-acetyltransferase [Solibacillus isronensis]
MLNLTTKRLTFERYTEKDLPFVVDLVSDPFMMKFIGNGQIKDKHYAIHLIERMLEQYQNFGDYGLHKLFHRQTGDFIGHAGLVAQVIDDTFEIELGYWIKRTYWGQGYGFEAAQALANYADEEMWLHRYISAIQVGNEGSKRIALKNGMHLEKTIEMDGKMVEIYVKLNSFEEDETEAL